jgi:hypothetical protein
MKHVTNEILIATINDLPETFDSHRLLQALATTHPHEYVRELAEKLETDDPIQQAHADIASQLNFAPFNNLVEKGDRVTTPNMRGRTRRTSSGIASSVSLVG